MKLRIGARFLFLMASCGVALALFADTPQPGADNLAQSGLAQVVSSARTNFDIHPGPIDGRVAFVTAVLLQQIHYSRQPFDQALSGKFYDKYIESLDPQHLHFLQTDLSQFEHYRTNLDRLTLTRRQVADTSPAFEIFNRFVERLQQRVAYADDLLKTEKFKFDGDDRINVSRHEAPYPKDMNEARQLWRERLRFEYLQEHLGKTGTKKKSEASASQDKKVEKPAMKKTEAETIVDMLSHRYHRNLRIFTDWDNEDVLQVYLNAMAHVYDPHSDYFNRAQLESFGISMNLSLTGIGAELISEDGYCTIRRLVPGGPAAKGKKIKEKDKIVAVAQGDQPPVDVVDMNLNKVVQMIRGPKGTEVRLTVIPAEGDSAQTVIKIVRDEIKLEDQAAKAKIIDWPAADGGKLRMGVINLPSFYAPFDAGGGKPELAASTEGHSGSQDVGGKSTSADVARLLKKLKQENVNGVILDLRLNGGGSLDEAVKTTGLFIKEGPVVQSRDFQGNIHEDDDTDPSVAYEGPLIVLTSRFSASASEIVAGALQDYGRALVVGDSATHGKGTVQSVNKLEPYMHLADPSLTNAPGALKVTIKKFYRASGASTQLKGVVPDIILPSVLNESKDIGESSLENPLPWDTIKTAKYEHLNLVGPYLEVLRKRSATRVDKDPEYAYVREDIELFKKAQADKTVSLNEKKRLKEKEETDARQKARDAERLARAEPKETVYELTLAKADLPGLPPPVAKTNTAMARLESQGGGTRLGTNSASVALPKGKLDDEGDEEKPPAPDPSLNEAEHILADFYALVSRKDGVLTAGQPRASQRN